MGSGMANTPCRPLLCVATRAGDHAGNAGCRAGCSMIRRARFVAIDRPVNRVGRFDKKTQLRATVLRPFGRSSNLAHGPLTPEHLSWTKYDPEGSPSDKTNEADKYIIRVKDLPSNKKIQHFSLKRQPTQHDKHNTILTKDWPTTLLHSSGSPCTMWLARWNGVEVAESTAAIATASLTMPRRAPSAT